MMRATVVLLFLATAWPAAAGQRPLSAAAASAATGAPLAPEAASLSLAQCIDRALGAGIRNKIAKADTDAARAIVGQARSSRYPELSASANYTRLDEDPEFVFPASRMGVPASRITTPPIVFELPANAFGPGFPPLSVPLGVPGQTIDVPAQAFAVPAQHVKLLDRNIVTAGFDAMFPLYTGGLASARIRQAAAGVDAAAQAERRTAQEITYDVTRAYYGLVLAQKLVVIGKDTLAKMTATLEFTESLFKNGSGRVKKTDYLRNLSTVETIRATVAGLEGQERAARAALEAATEWQGATPLAVADADLPFQPIDCKPESVLPQALAANADIGRVAAGLAAADAGIAVARSGHLPKVGLFGRMNLIGNSYDAGIVSSRNKMSWAAGVGVDVPIFQGFRVVNEEREARATRRRLEGQQALVRTGVTFEVRRTCSDVLAAAEAARAATDAAKAAAENADLNVRAYQDELVETKDVIEAQIMDALLTASQQKALYDHLEALARLDIVTGRMRSTVAAR